MNKFSIAVLLTCHNRREKTLACLSALYRVELPKEYEFSVFLVDDGSTDGSGNVIKKNFPQVNIIQGSGNLFWNGGMRLAWDIAVKYNLYDFFLWLNDDTILETNSLKELFVVFDEGIKKDNKPPIVIGACKEDFNNNKFSYGGRNDNGPLIPNGELQTCKYINGNVVLVPDKVFKILGNLSPEFTHTLGDYDYGLRAINSGFKCYTTKKYIAICPSNDTPNWCNPNIPFKKRKELFYSPKGLNFKEYNKFRKKFWGNKWVLYAVKSYLRMLFPLIYNKIRFIKL